MSFTEWSRRKKILAVILASITILYALLGVLLFTDIQLMESPKITAHIDVLELNADDVLIQLNLTMENPNSFPMIARDFTITLSTDDTEEVAIIRLDGGVIDGGKQQSFETTDSIQFRGDPVSTLYVDIDSRVGASFVQVLTKTIPLHITVITPLEKVIDELAAPTIHIDADLTELTQQGVNISATIETTNPNAFDLFINDTVLDIVTDTGVSVGQLTIPDIILEGKQIQTFTVDGFVELAALNADTLDLELTTHAGLLIAGVEKTLSVATTATVHLPDLNALLSQNMPTNMVMRGDYKLTLSGIRINVSIEINNPNNIDIQARNLTVSIHRVDNDQETFITKTEVGGGIAPAGDALLVSGDLLVPYRSLLITPGHVGFPDWLLVGVFGNMSIPGIDANLWIGISEYQDMQLLK